MAQTPQKTILDRYFPRVLHPIIAGYVCNNWSPNKAVYTGLITDLAFSSDTELVVADSDDDLKLHKVQLSTSIQISQLADFQKNHRHDTVVLSTNGAYAVFARPIRNGIYDRISLFDIFQKKYVDLTLPPCAQDRINSRARISVVDDKFVYLYYTPSGSTNSKVVKWDFHDQRQEFTFKHYGVLSASFSGDGIYLAVLLAGKYLPRAVGDFRKPDCLQIIDTRTQSVIKHLENTAHKLARNETAICFMPKKQALIIGGADGSVRILDLQTDTIEQYAHEHKKAIVSIRIAAHGPYFVTGSGSSSDCDQLTYKIWRTGIPKSIATITCNAFDAALSPSGACFAISHCDTVSQKIILDMYKNQEQELLTLAD